MRILLTILLATAAHGQLLKDLKGNFDITKNNITKAAEKMTEEQYGYQPTPEVRTFGQLIGHVADAQYLFCSAAAVETVAPKGVEKGVKSKAGLVAAVKEAFAYCDKVYAGLNDEVALKSVKFFGSDRTKAGVLSFNNMHNYEHYGNIVTYMRIKGLVPPSSERQ